MSTSWEEEAENWVRWARTPGHDAFWHYASSFFDEILPHPRGTILEIGCGEGRVARALRDRGHEVVAVDPSPTLVARAADEDSDSIYLVAEAEHLPFPTSLFALVIAYNSLQNVGNLSLSIREAARVLEPSGRLCVCIAHPVSDAGRFADESPEAAFVIHGSYLGRRRVDERVERDGLEITFHGWAYPLEDYARALEEAGFLIERLREPLPAQASSSRFAQWRRVPLFLLLRAIKR